MDSIVNFDNIPWVQIHKGMRCKLYINGNKQIRMIELSEEFEELDWCVHSHTNYVLEGEFAANFGGKIVNYKKGDILYIPEGMKHKVLLGINCKVVLLDF